MTVMACYWHHAMMAPWGLWLVETLTPDLTAALVPRPSLSYPGRGHAFGSSNMHPLDWLPLSSQDNWLLPTACMQHMHGLAGCTCMCMACTAFTAVHSH